MKTIKLLKEIRNDYVNKFDNDPLIKRVCDVMINEYKARSKAFSLKDVVTSVLCVDKEKDDEGLTIGEKYKLIEEDEKHIYIKDNLGEEFGYFKCKFKKL
jgi:hypothetical protein